jgi:hypothetical protein
VDADGTVLIAPYGSTEYVGIGTTNPTAKLDVNGTVKASIFESTVASGTAPFVVASTTQVTNLNANYLNGYASDTTNTANRVVRRDASGNFSAGTITATLFSGSGASLTNIPNGALDNSTVSYGGVQLSLGGSDATPAFNLQDATNYPYASLTGITTSIVGDTTPQLGGDLDLNSNNITGTGNIDITGSLNVSGVSTFQGNVYLGDNDRIYFGDSIDSSIHHDGNNLFLLEGSGTGNLYIRGNSLQLQAPSNENYLIAYQNGAVELYYDNSKKFETTGIGVSIVGTGNTATITGPSNLVLDPAAVGDATGTVTILGNLQVDGTQTIINSTTMTVDDLNITLASGAANAAAANGAGLTVDGASATLTYSSTGDSWVFNKAPYYNTNKILTTADEGTGNGLDADTLDTLEASSFLRSDAADTATGAITFSGGQTWNSHITWNASQNITIAGESSFDIGSGGTWQVWDASTSNNWITASYGQPLVLNSNALTTIVNTSNSIDYFRVRHRSDTDITMDFYCESNTTQVADTFSGNTDKKYIYFSNPNSSSDPGYIMHETRGGESNEGVLHLVPSDDNAEGDYVSIHGTDDADQLKLHTSGLIETANVQLELRSGSSGIYLNDNVGINTTTPGSTLAVGGTITELYDGTYWNVVTQADVGYGASQVPLNQYLGQLAFLDDFSPNGLRRDGGGEDDVVVDVNGNVGVGTTNPTSRFTVVGDANISGVGTLGQLNVSGISSFRNGNSTYGTSTALSAEFGVNTTAAGAIKLHGTTSNAYGLIQATTSNLHIDCVVGGTYLNFYDGDFVSFGTGAAAESGRFTGSTGTLTLGSTGPTGTASQRLQVTGGAYVSGNLGIGATNPTVALELGKTKGNNQIRLKSSDGNVDMRINPAFGNADVASVGVVGAYPLTFHTSNTERVRITSTGDVGIGTTNPQYKLHVVGSFGATTKSFIIDHPTQEGKKLQYGSLEGPELGVYVRGRTQSSIIELPDYWTGLVDEETITVNLTPIGRKAPLHSVVDIVDNTVVVESANDVVDCFYTVFGERKDVAKLEVEF